MIDMISRQAAIDSPVKMVSEGLEWIPVYYIKELPSVELERLTDDFETIRIHLNAQKEKLCNQQRWEEAEEYQRIIDRFMAFASVEPERKNGKWTTEEVAELLSNLFGDECACNYNGIDEWLPERCKYTEIADECPNPKEKHGCWMQFLLQGGADMRGEQE